uniref:ms55 n=1 Tax=Trypanosoma brucei brucei TaxID=5702 RepID=UPI000E6AE371|nr:Chain DH, ms55 [Trypanosoma brucei brucei]6HIW_DH Chain DH, mS55 [Trypanosoma brucei brucei]6HIZ_DH Chain DH, mS55 [Trypanosoma brucei brucei]6SG9_DH Chain DH, mS55 (KRIPP8) [Trypanosoma brucei brucei]6SGB_DH Chain DH, mS55 (KRIPP8) [Trypanosoma brucei brucei]7PUA_DH Chain DH, mS55 [Trypanosoma brucei brucei]7PUB_DH Chain DH, mS55 [Trypanosoma brucei brucei]
MLSQNVAKTTVPSYYMIRTNLPHRKPQNQWEGVYYYSGITKRQRHLILLHRKREREAHMRSFNISRASVLQRLEQLSGDRKQESLPPHVRLDLAVRLAQHGLYQQATPIVDELHHQKALHAGHYALLINALACPRLGQRILHCDAQCDPALTYKLLGDENGEERAQEAYRWFDLALTSLAVDCGGRTQPSHFVPYLPQGTAAASHITNALMRTLLTCGYTHVAAIPDSVYDRMGSMGISPTISTYELVMLALSLQGNMVEAESILSFLRSHHSEHITVESFNALLLGHREARQFDCCDAIWQELVDRRWPRASPLTAELYLRSIMDHANTPTSEPLQSFANINVVEKKKVPLVLAQMDELGVPRTHLSRVLMDEVEDSLRKFQTYRSRFYEWGRAVKQFDFIEFRRRNGWLYDLHLMKCTTKQVGPLRDFNDPDAVQGAVATAEIPAFFNERPAWERPPLEETLYVTTNKERYDDVRGGDIYYDDTRGLHDRSPTWMNEVPETRYDRLYGVNHPDIAKIGIRRHLNVEYVNRKEVVERDAALMKKTLSSGRRLRHRVESSRTHRNAGSLSGISSTAGGGSR